MKKLFLTLSFLLLSLALVAQTGKSVVLDGDSFRVEQTDVLTGANIDPIGKDRSNRECFRLKLHLDRMTPEDIAEIEVRVLGGNVVLMKREMASGGNGLILEMTARPDTRLYVRHPSLGESNIVTISPEGGKVYLMDGWAEHRLTVVVSCSKVGAEVWLDGAFRGVIGSDNTLSIPEVIAGMHTLKVRSGEADCQQQIEVSSGKVFFNVELRNAALLQQFVVFNVYPSDALIMLDGEPLIVKSGVASKLVRFGTHEFSVSARNHHPSVGTVVVNDVKGKQTVSVNLAPAYGWLSVQGASSEGAYVYLDNNLLGQAPIKSDPLPSGEYVVKIVKPLYKSLDLSVTVSDGKVSYLDPTLTPDFSTVSLSVDNNAEIWVNGELKGLGTWTGDLARGDYMVECRKNGHRPTSETLTVTEGMPARSVRLRPPEPLCGTLTITSEPELSEVYLDGVHVGQTPLYLPESLVGNHELKITHSGCSVWVGEVVVREGEVVEVTAVLRKNSPAVSVPHKMVSVKDVSFCMVLVKGGSFTMGATSGQGADSHEAERPAHNVILSDFYMGETEVTQDLWMAVMGNNPAQYDTGNDRPVTHVSWNDCQEFVEALSAMTGHKFRLPTEAEWEYAARGGNKSGRYKYSGGSDLEDVAWYDGNSEGQTHPVKTKHPNELGLYDMSGNVWEWCNDWYGEYCSVPQTNPKGPESGFGHVLRGGDWRDGPTSCRVSHRDYGTPGYSNKGGGLRLVMIP